jgi:hypothetical protein
VYSVKGNKNYNTVNFFINDIKVGSTTKRMEAFCTVKNGTPSRVRDKSKWCYFSKWDTDGLKQVFGDKAPNTWDKSSPWYLRQPDYTWGDTGDIITIAKIKDLIIDI